MTTNLTHFITRVQPAVLHFNAAHFITIDRACENLHGHNFHVSVDAHGADGGEGFVLDFVLLTRLAEAVCRSLHDRVLLPAHNPEVRLEQRDGLIHVSSYDKRFALPAPNCAVLPVANTTAELLAWHINEELLRALDEHGQTAGVARLEVGVEEADRQWGICRRELNHD